MEKLKEIIFVIIEEAQEGGYLARALDYSIFTEGDTRDELKELIQDAVQCHIEPEEKPIFFSLSFSLNHE